MAIGPYIRRSERLRVDQVRIQGQQQRRAFLDEADPGVTVAMNAALVAFRLSKPPFEVEVVLRQVLRLSPNKQPGGKTCHHAAHVVPHRISALLELRLQALELHLPLGRCAGSRRERRLNSADILDVGP